VTPERLEAALDRIDGLNAADPNEADVAGERGPKELLHGRRAMWWVQRLDPDATDAQLLAARAHHLRRWLRPRSAYPEGRAGYLRWRTDAKRAHAAEVGDILAAAGYSTDVAEDVGRIIRKEGLATDRRVQTHEDALCLTFLETGLDDLIAQLGDDHMVEVLAKTARKMSPAGLAAAAELPLSEHARGLLGRALATD